VVLDPDLDPWVVGEVAALEPIGGKGRLRQLDEPLGMLDHPARIDPHVVGDHVAGEADAVPPGPFAEPSQRVLAAEIVGDPVVVQGVRRRHGVGVAAPALDPLRGPRALP
jgi:hypothetical protein